VVPKAKQDSCPVLALYARFALQAPPMFSQTRRRVEPGPFFGRRGATEHGIAMREASEAHHRIAMRPSVANACRRLSAWMSGSR